MVCNRNCNKHHHPKLATQLPYYIPNLFFVLEIQTTYDDVYPNKFDKYLAVPVFFYKVE